MLSPKRMTPPTSPRRIRPRRPADGVVPVIRTTSFCPTSCASVGSAWMSGPAGGDASGFSAEGDGVDVGCGVRVANVAIAVPAGAVVAGAGVVDAGVVWPVDARDPAA